MVIVPLSLLPPTMIALLDAPLSTYLPIFQIQPSPAAASVFFGGEMFSVFLMGWLIKLVARACNHDVTYAEAYLVAAIASVPLWLSSLGMLVNNPFLNTMLPLSALVSCCVLVYQGTCSLCRVDDRLEAAAITQAAFGAAVIVWIMVLPLVWSATA
ncbi:hypothetical protein YO5_08893 [Stutzerimonas stutzeri TS44]|nr:hypothetical protein YO5_08893 [Stutzerimonas stutzeri TS44]